MMNSFDGEPEKAQENMLPPEVLNQESKDNEYIEHLLGSLPEELRDQWEEKIWGDKDRVMNNREIIELLEDIMKKRADALTESRILQGIQDAELREKIKDAITEVERQFEEGKVSLGEGNYAKVFGVPEASVVCIKFLKDEVQGEKHLKIITREIDILETLRDVVVAGIRVPYVYAKGLTHQPYYFVMETIQGHSLKDIFGDPQNLLPKKIAPQEQLDFAKRIVSQNKEDVIANFTQYLEELHERKKIIHGDIHAGNIMIDKNGNWFLIDFGLGLVMDIGVDLPPEEMPYKARTTEEAKESELRSMRTTIEEVFGKAKLLTN